MGFEQGRCQESRRQSSEDVQARTEEQRRRCARVGPRVRQMNEISTGCSWQKPVVAGRKFEPLSLYHHHPMHHIAIIDPPTVATPKRRYEKRSEAKRREEKRREENIGADRKAEEVI